MVQVNSLPLNLVPIVTSGFLYMVHDVHAAFRKVIVNVVRYLGVTNALNDVSVCTHVHTHACTYVHAYMPMHT